MFFFLPWHLFVSKLWQSLNESFQSVQLSVCCLFWGHSRRQARSSFPLWRPSSLKPTLWQSIRQLIVLALINYQLILCLLCMTWSSSSHWLDPAGPPLLLKSSRYRLFHIFSPFALQVTPHIATQRSQFPSRVTKCSHFQNHLTSKRKASVLLNTQASMR